MLLAKQNLGLDSEDQEEINLVTRNIKIQI